MGNVLHEYTRLWVVDSTGALDTTNIVVQHVVYVPSAANDDIILDDSNGNIAIVLKAGASDASPIHIDFGPQGRRFAGLTVDTIDGGTLYLYLL